MTEACPAPAPAAIHEDDPDLARLAAEGRVVAYFGYGSLVNRLTLRTRFLGIRRASVTGWRRAWMRRASPNMALLSVRPDEGFETQGVVVYDHADHLPSVDEREAAYVRRVVMPGHAIVENAPVPDVPIFIYEASPEEPDAAELGATIMQSYLDAVLQGFLSLYGEAGVRRFVEETEGFETAILRDREAPLYPRSVILRGGDAELFDALVAARGGWFCDPA
ncbi:gamma-glutamylcyclotransferase family protein [Aureimonas sp. AU12]|uniref:gamma-glutamylcyclotransferase family protein n=1 Tax=Aureimonas sp. AU12 TaxID=1638161 RepID=UPI000780E7EF|nr:gamma-glutamylcyclotransferase family protein [Aureimonas sp. AU12]